MSTPNPHPGWPCENGQEQRPPCGDVGPHRPHRWPSARAAGEFESCAGVPKPVEQRTHDDDGACILECPPTGDPRPCPCTPGEQERREEYAAAMCAAEGRDWEEVKASYPDDAAEYRRIADAAIVKADAEQRGLSRAYYVKENEVARLREQNSNLKFAYDEAFMQRSQAEDEVRRLRAEVERLRKAVECPAELAELEETAAHLEKLAQDCEKELAENAYWHMSWPVGMRNALGGPSGELGAAMSPRVAQSLAAMFRMTVLKVRAGEAVGVPDTVLALARIMSPNPDAPEPPDIFGVWSKHAPMPPHVDT